MSGPEDEQRNRRRGLLKQYYGFNDENKEGFDPYNINAPEFNPDLFLHKVIFFSSFKFHCYIYCYSNNFYWHHNSS